MCSTQVFSLDLKTRQHYKFTAFHGSTFQKLSIPMNTNVCFVSWAYANPQILVPGFMLKEIFFFLLPISDRSFATRALWRESLHGGLLRLQYVPVTVRDN